MERSRPMLAAGSGRGVRTWSSRVRRILAFSLAHFGAAMLIAVVAFGPDMDQLRSRSAWSRAAAAVHDVLWFPHDAVLRAVPNAWLVRNTYVVPLALVLNSLAWGTALFLTWRAVRRRGERAPRGRA